MKKILLMTFEYPTGKIYCGGVGQMVQQSRQALAALGHEVYVLISVDFKKKRPAQLLLPDGRLIHYPDFFSYQKEYPFKFFHVIIQHFVNWTQDLKRLKSHKGKRPEIIYHFHSILRREKDSGFRTFNKFLLNQEKMIQIADRIVCPSRYEYDNFNRYFPYYSGKLSLIENIVNVFAPDKKQIAAIRAAYGIKKNDTIAIYVGRIERAKGAHILIRHLPDILKGRRGVKVFIVGKVLERSLYRKLAAIRKEYPKQVFYIKYIEKRRLFQFYYLSDIYINTSLSESFSLSTYEGGFCRNALLLNRLPVFERFQKGALFFSPANANGDGFLHKLQTLLKNRSLRRRLGKAAHQATNQFLADRDLVQDFSRFIGDTNK